MEISGFTPKNYTDQSSSQSFSIEEQIRKLEDQKRKIQQDLAKKSNNPDPKAAIGDNIANSSVNQKILEKIEAKIKNLEARKSSSSDNINTNDNKITQSNSSQHSGHLIDIMA